MPHICIVPPFSPRPFNGKQKDLQNKNKAVGMLRDRVARYCFKMSTTPWQMKPKGKGAPVPTAHLITPTSTNGLETPPNSKKKRRSKEESSPLSLKRRKRKGQEESSPLGLKRRERKDQEASSPLSLKRRKHKDKSPKSRGPTSNGESAIKDAKEKLKVLEGENVSLKVTGGIQVQEIERLVRENKALKRKVDKLEEGGGSPKKARKKSAPGNAEQISDMEAQITLLRGKTRELMSSLTESNSKREEMKLNVAALNGKLLEKTQSHEGLIEKYQDCLAKLQALVSPSFSLFCFPSFSFFSTPHLSMPCRPFQFFVWRGD